MGKAILEIEVPATIIDALCLPCGTELITRHIVIEHETLPEATGENLPEVYPVLRSQCGQRVFDHWGFVK